MKCYFLVLPCTGLQDPGQAVGVDRRSCPDLLLLRGRLRGPSGLRQLQQIRQQLLQVFIKSHLIEVVALNPKMRLELLLSDRPDLTMWKQRGHYWMSADILSSHVPSTMVYECMLRMRKVRKSILRWCWGRLMETYCQFKMFILATKPNVWNNWEPWAVGNLMRKTS